MQTTIQKELDRKTRLFHKSNSERKVLVVEDDTDLTAIIDDVLKSIDPKITVDWATSADQAIDLIEGRLRESEESPYEMILADIFLEGNATGVDLWRLCKKSLPQIPIVVMSSLPVNQFFTMLGHDTIAPPFLGKPFQAGQCKQMLEGILAQKAEYKTQ